MDDFKSGVKAGIPIGLGYLSVSTGFGIFAVASGLYWWQAVLISMLTVTSAGQLAGVRIMAAGGSLFSTLISQLTINIRYSFMSISLSQKLDKDVTNRKKLGMGFLMTDEIFAVASTKNKVTSSFFGWTLGTLIGAVLGNVLSASVMSAMGLAMYGMFVAIVVPDMKKNKDIFILAFLAMAISAAFYYLPLLKNVSIGIAISISAVVAAAVMAFLRPIPDEQEEA